MKKLSGWGWLLALALPLLVFFSWSRLGGESARIQLERFAAGGANVPMQPLVEHFLKHKQVAAPGDVVLPAVPKKSGVKAWSVQADTTLRVELDAKVDGRPVQLVYVPVVRSATGFYYDCVSSTSPLVVGQFCTGEVVKTLADIPAQLQANALAVRNLPTVVSASGVDLAADAAAGSVVVVPGTAAELNACGFQCVKPQSCVTPRPLVCGRQVDEGSSRYFEMVATPDDFRGNSLATRSAADEACVKTVGAGYSVASASGLGGVVKLAGGSEYWVHNDVRRQENCWK
ncbi:MAG: hypothetical protein V4627_02925 [Pseudomonadota bacterium]